MPAHTKIEGSVNWLYSRFFMTKMVIGAVALWCASSYTLSRLGDVTYSAENAETYLEQKGYNSVTLQGVNHFPTNMEDCGADTIEYEFIAVNPKNVSLNIDVCKRLGQAPKVEYDK